MTSEVKLEPTAEDGGAVEAGRDDLIMSLQDAIMMWSHSNKTVAVCYVTDAKAAIAQLQSDAAEITRLRAENAGMREALEPFAAVAEHDIGETETDLDIFRPMSANNHAPKLTVGDLRRARAALAKASQAEGQTP